MQLFCILLTLQTLLELQLEVCHDGVFHVLSRVQLASDAELVARLLALDAKDHEKVRLDGLGDVVIGQVNRLDCLAL